MNGFRRWMLVLPVIVTIIGKVGANEEPHAPDLAASAVAQAEAAVKLASGERALWTSAEDALRKAHRALQEGNSAVAIEQAHIAQKQAELGMAQKSYPLFR
jgi:hypothetical protein